MLPTSFRVNTEGGLEEMVHTLGHCNIQSDNRKTVFRLERMEEVQGFNGQLLIRGNFLFGTNDAVLTKNTWVLV